MKHYYAIFMFFPLIMAGAVTPFNDPGKTLYLIKRDAENIVSHKERYNLSDFNSFLQGVYKWNGERFLNKEFMNNINNTGMEKREANNIYRLLGIYTRLKYSNEILELLSRMVPIKTYKISGLPQHKNPGITKFGKLLEKFSLDNGLVYRNIKNLIFEVTLKGRGDKSIGIYTHCDTVPAEKNDWVLDNGTALDPFKMTVVDGRIYGRGVLDNKGSIALALYSMKAVKESGIKPAHTVKLIIETSEETGSHGINYYRKTDKLPHYNAVLDNMYPVTVNEKGYGELTISFRKQYVKGKAPEIINVSGGSAPNIIPLSSTAVIRTENPGILKARLASESKLFNEGLGKGLTFSFRQGRNRLYIIAKGVSAHSSEPQHGINPVQGIFCFLHVVSVKIRFRNNHFTRAAAYIFDNYGTGYYGEKLGISFRDRESGPLTASLTQVISGRKEIRLLINLRVPWGAGIPELKRDLAFVHKKYMKRKKTSFIYKIFIGSPFRSNAPADFIRLFTDVFNETTGIKKGPVSAGGGTSARYLPRAVSFGPCYPGEKCMMHIENEYREKGRFLLDMQMVTEMVLRAGNY